MRSQQKRNRKHRNRTVALLLILSFLIAMLPTFMLSAEADTDEITIVREEAERRNANERHYLCSDGSIMAVAFSGDVHYLDADGKYQVIDNSLVYDNTKGIYRTKDNPNFKVTFGSNTKSPSVQMTNGEGNTLTAATTVALRLESAVARRALESASASLKVANREKITVAGKSKQSADLLKVPENSSEMKYQNSFGNGISAEYAVDGYSLKENVVFEYPVNYTAIETRYTMDGLWVDINDDGSLILYNEDNVAIYTVAAPYMYDAAGSECPSVDVQATLEGDTIVVRYIPDEAWRSSSERVYPVVFDPMTTPVDSSDISVNAYSVTKNGSFNGVSTNTKLLAGYNYLTSNGNRFVYRSYIELNEYPTIPDGNTVMGLTLTFTKHEAFGSGTLNMYTINANSDFAENTYSFENYIGGVTYSGTDSTTEYTFSLPPEITTQSITKCVIKDSNDTDTGTTPHYMTFYSSRWSTVSQRPKLVAIYVPQGLASTKTTLYHPDQNQHLSAVSDSAISMESYASTCSEWQLVLKEIGSFQIQSLCYPGKCLATDVYGNVFLTDTQHSINSNNRNQLWYVIESDGQYAIINEKHTSYLYVDGNGVCRTGVPYSDEHQWQFAVPDVVVTLKNTDTQRWLKSEYGKDYNDQKFILGSYEQDNIADKCGFRLVYDADNSAYKIMPIASRNGYYRALTIGEIADASGSDYTIQYEETSSNASQQSFVLERQGTDQYTIRLLNSDLYLTDNGNGNCGRMWEENSGFENQMWVIDTYMYVLPSGQTAPYSEVEEYYSSLGFDSPFESDFAIKVTSDFGIRDINGSLDVHEGIDLRTKRNDSDSGIIPLYSAISGTVVDIYDEDEYRNNNRSEGLHIKIDTGIPAYNDSRYTICIVYMHLSSFNTEVLNDFKEAEDNNSTYTITPDIEIGKSGNTGRSTGAHLHYGVFLSDGSSYLASAMPLNPLWFIT